MNYDQIKEIASREKVPVTDLIVLAPANDPCYMGKPNDLVMGRWFAALWQRYGYTNGVHLRRVHYQVVSQQPKVQFPVGVKVKIGKNDRGDAIYTTEYVNTESCWDYLVQAGKVARYLGLVPMEAFVDRRNPEPQIYAQDVPPDPSIEVDDQLWNAPAIPEFPELPVYRLHNYMARQRYHLELWAEKSTMNDVLIPICQQFRMNYVTGLGEMSITSSLALLERVIQDGRPAIIFYVSDFDPAGMSMPVATARRIESLIRDREDETPRVRLIPIVLTAQQVQHYQLPRTPIKDSERRGARFEERHGEGAVELDALEALRPGELTRIVRRHIADWWDRDLNARIFEARDKLSRELDDIASAVMEEYAPEIGTLRLLYDEIRADFEQRIAEFNASLNRVWLVLADELENRMPSLTTFPLPEAEEGDGEFDRSMFDSARGYMEQLRAYKQHQGKRPIDLDDDA